MIFPSPNGTNEVVMAQCQGHCGKDLQEDGMCAACLEGARFLNRRHAKLLSDALLKLLVALHVVRDDVEPSGPELLCAAEEASKHFQEGLSLNKAELETIYTLVESSKPGTDYQADALCGKLRKMIGAS
jgi:hypothetical protein